MPPLLAVGAAHHRLLDEGLRCRASLVVDSAQCWSVHHVACLRLLRGVGGLSLPRARDRAPPRHRHPGPRPAAGVARSRGAPGQGRRQLPRRSRIGAPEGPLQGRHLPARQLPWSAAPRGGRHRGRPAGTGVRGDDVARRRSQRRGARARDDLDAPARLPRADRREAAELRLRPLPVGRRAPRQYARGGQDAAPSGRGERRDPLRGLPSSAGRPALHHHSRPSGAQERARPDPADGGRTGRADHAALLHRRHVPGRPVGRSARDAGHRHEPPRGKGELRRGRGGSGAPRAARRRRRERPLGAPPRAHRSAQRGPSGDGHPPSRIGTLRRHGRVPRGGRADRDQGGSGRQARRGRPAPRRQGHAVHRASARRDAGHDPDLPPAAPRHLLHRGPRAAHLRPAPRQPSRVDLRQARRRTRSGDHRRRGRQGRRRRDPHRRAQRGHGRRGAQLDQTHGDPLGAGADGGAPTAFAHPSAHTRRAAGRRRPAHGTRRRRRRRHGGAGVRLRFGGDDGGGVHHGPCLPHQRLPGRSGHAARGSAPPVRGDAGARREPLPLHRRGRARAARRAGLPLPRGADRAQRPARSARPTAVSPRRPRSTRAG